MKTSQQVWSEPSGWQGAQPWLERAQLVFVFGGIDPFAQARWLPSLRAACPEALLFGCSTAGEIAGTAVNDDTVVATALEFQRTPVRHALVHLTDVEGSVAAGRSLAAQLPRTDLAHVIVISDGQQVNGSELVRGLAAELPPGVRVTGGLAGDGGRFERTLILAGEEPLSGAVAAIGLYGEALQVGYGSLGGWDPFGPERTITRSTGNVLYEIDGTSALDLYRSYLGEHADGLPATGLLFPLQIRRQGDVDAVVRTILNVDESSGSLIFAGDVPVGARTQLMKTNYDTLVQGASEAALACRGTAPPAEPAFALLISCVGRKLVLKQRIEEEVEAVQRVFGAGTLLTGFYSHGEICPSATNASLELHNQTMTITTLSET